MAIKTTVAKAPTMILGEVKKGDSEYRLRVETHEYTGNDGIASSWTNNILEVRHPKSCVLNEWHKLELGYITSQELVNVMAEMFRQQVQCHG